MDRRFARSVVLAVAFVVALPSAARSDDLFLPWTELAPSLTEGYDPYSENLCKQGHENCVHSVIREMDRRFSDLCDVCDHNAIFALTYLRTTEVYHDFWHEGHFSDPGFMNHYDAVFGEYYFRAYDDWYKNQGKNRDRVPPAWRVAFSAADKREVSGSGNLFLGMNAHINRDLPFVLESIGLVAPDGTSRKPDHDKVNEFLSRVSPIIFPELERRFDPTINQSNIGGTTLDDFLTFQVVPTWRERAWRNAERLKSAATTAERDMIAAEIEETARVEAEMFRAQNRYTMLSSYKAADRDAYCAQNNWNV